ncbi:hypothetical protein ES703_92269 [subsurface metagenome]
MAARLKEDGLKKRERRSSPRQRGGKGRYALQGVEKERRAGGLGSTAIVAKFANA